jgi:hypothetical protein
MSKEQAWKELESAWSQRCSEFCVGMCSCGEDFSKIKEILYV